MEAIVSYRVFHSVVSIWMTSLIVLQKTDAQQSSKINDPSSDSSLFFYQQSEHPRDCKEVHDQCSSSNSSGVYFIRPVGCPEPFDIYCDNGGDLLGWTVIQRRDILHGNVRFDRDWNNYKQGFGFLFNEYWIGNERLSYLTNQKNYQLLIEMTLSNGSTLDLFYNNFRISDELSGYELVSVSRYSGTADPIRWMDCPHNMVVDVCTCGQRSCREPTVCQNTCEGERSVGCICPDGFYMNGGNCVPGEECGCYVPEEQTVVPEGETYVDEKCTRVAVCSKGKLTQNEAREECSPNAMCEERNGEKKCYCKDGYYGDGATCIDDATDCMDIYEAGVTASGIYSIRPNTWPGSAFNVYCNMTDGGGWTVFQRRIDGSVDFYLGWGQYKAGFGELDNEHWLGNEKLYYLTNQRSYQLRIDVVNTDGDPYYAKFDSFLINNEGDNYRLAVLGTYSGDADERSSADGYALTYHRGQPFSTKDSDNDDNSYDYDYSSIDYGSCAQYHRGAWWYDNCYYSNLNGRYSDNFDMYYIPGSNNLVFSEMKVRPV